MTHEELPPEVRPAGRAPLRRVSAQAEDRHVRHRCRVEAVSRPGMTRWRRAMSSPMRRTGKGESPDLCPCCGRLLRGHAAHRRRAGQPLRVRPKPAAQQRRVRRSPLRWTGVPGDPSRIDRFRDATGGLGLFERGDVRRHPGGAEFFDASAGRDDLGRFGIREHPRHATADAVAPDANRCLTTACAIVVRFGPGICSCRRG